MARAKTDADCDTHFIRVTVLGTNKLGGRERAILRIDEIDVKGGVLADGIYYAYVDTLPQGTRVVCRYRNDGGDLNETTGVRRGIPFPMRCARPPLLGAMNDDKDGYVNDSGDGVKFVRRGWDARTGVITVDATHFETAVDLGGKAPESPAWYRGDIEDVMRDSRTKVLFREKQHWENASSWLWDEMERVDKDGNLMMRCRKKAAGESALQQATNAPAGGIRSQGGQ